MMKVILLPALLAASLLAGSVFAVDVAPMAQLQTTGAQVTNRPKVPVDEGVDGEYFFFGQSLQILLASGEVTKPFTLQIVLATGAAASAGTRTPQ